jgi:hypothetical protein
MDSLNRNDIIDGYMKRACAQFNKICGYDLTDRNDETREFNITIPDDEIDEIADIVTEGMLVQWMKPYVYKVDNLENVLNTADFSAYSPAELLYRISNAYDVVKKDFVNMMREYSYNHGDLSALSL